MTFGVFQLYVMSTTALISPCIIHSDIDDENEVEANIHYNETQNGKCCCILSVLKSVLNLLCCALAGLAVGRHVAHTWGTPWTFAEPIQYIIASDILLYVR